jgi:hypothetical protein
MSNEFEFQTTLNGGIVTVVLQVEKDFDEDGETTTVSFDSVWFDSVDITSILTTEQINALEMEAEAGLSNEAWELSNV